MSNIPIVHIIWYIPCTWKQLVNWLLRLQQFPAILYIADIVITRRTHTVDLALKILWVEFSLFLCMYTSTGFFVDKAPDGSFFLRSMHPLYLVPKQSTSVPNNVLYTTTAPCVPCHRPPPPHLLPPANLS